jgi:transposase
LLAYIMVAKFADHLPLYSQEKTFGRAGLRIARSTWAQWVGNCGLQLQPQVDALREAVLTHGFVHADETPAQMLTPARFKWPSDLNDV